MLEKMDEFFDNRVDFYEEHQLNHIAFAKEFYKFTAFCLPKESGAKILDLGCGTGLELDYYFKINPYAEVTCVDLSEKMLEVLRRKFLSKNIHVIKGSYFDITFEKAYFDSVLSVESLHHFTKEEKIKLYCRIYETLTEKGYFLLTDYFADSEEEEKTARSEFEHIKITEGIQNNDIYHFDTPLTVENESDALINAGFSKIEISGHWASTYTIKASK